MHAAFDGTVRALLRCYKFLLLPRFMSNLLVASQSRDVEPPSGGLLCAGTVGDMLRPASTVDTIALVYSSVDGTLELA
jgi:hypothetical protein